MMKSSLVLLLVVVFGFNSANETNETYTMVVSEDFAIENLLLKDARCNETTVLSDEGKYLTHLSDASKYIECVSVGLGIEHTCPMNKVFEANWKYCTLGTISSVWANMTKVSRSLQTRNQPRPKFTSKSLSLVNGATCMNNGTKDVFSACICLIGFSGPTCEQTVDAHVTYMYQRVLNASFSLDYYVKNVWDSSVAPVQYVLHFPNGKQVGYDQLLTGLVAALWSEISPEAFFLSVYDYNAAQNASSLQKITLYTKYVYSGFNGLFARLRKVLTQLRASFTKSSCYKEIRLNANAFMSDWLKANNNSYRVTASAGVNVKNELNSALGLLSKHEGPMGDALHKSMAKQWDMVVDYGFWHLTNTLTYPILKRNRTSI